MPQAQQILAGSDHDFHPKTFIDTDADEDDAFHDPHSDVWIVEVPWDGRFIDAFEDPREAATVAHNLRERSDPTFPTAKTSIKRVELPRTAEDYFNERRSPLNY